MAKKVRFSFRYLRNRRLRGRSEPDVPVPFVVGVGRSGTTLLRLILDAHPELAIPPETHFLPALIQRSGQPLFGPRRATRLIVTDEHRRWPDFGLEEEQLLERLQELRPFNLSDAVRAFYLLYAERHGKPRWGDKTPTYVRRMGAIKRTLPEVRFIHVIRDGRDVMLSTNQRIKQRGHRDPLSPAAAARRWRRQITKARELGPRVGDYMEIRYEDLVTDTEATVRRVCDFIALDYDPQMLRYHERAEERLKEMAGAMPARAGRPAREAGERLRAHRMATKPPSKERIARWREEMDPADRAEFERYAGSLLRELGYEVGSG